MKQIHTIKVLMGNEIREFEDSPSLREHLEKKGNILIGERSYQLNEPSSLDLINKKIHEFRKLTGGEPRYVVLSHDRAEEFEMQWNRSKDGLMVRKVCGLEVLKVLSPGFMGVC